MKSKSKNKQKKATEGKSESEIRDLLVKRLDIFGEGLELIDKEAYLPNKLGTKGFIDILAKDKYGRYIIIELKKSGPASREALHEVLKYIEGLKANKKLKDSEIRVFIVSTIWDELLIPFSSFHKKSKCPVEGFLLKIDENGEPSSVSKIIPVKLNNDRLLSDYHMIRYYSSEANLQNGIRSHIDSFAEKGVEDYVLLMLKAPPGLHEKEISSTISGFKSITGKTDNDLKDEIEKIKQCLPDYGYIIYSAVQILDEPEYLRILSMDHNLYDEVQEYIVETEGEERIQILHEYAIDNVEPLPFSESLEIAYPAKLSSKLDSVGWKIESIYRGGGFKANELLSDKSIIEELRGSSGTNRQTYSQQIDSRNLVLLNQIRDEVKICLENNLPWQRQILHILEELQSKAEKDNFTGKIHIYNPQHTLLSIVLTVTERTPLYIPDYYIHIETEHEKMTYFGCMIRNTNKPNLKQVMQEFYDSDEFAMLFPLTGGGYEARDVEIAKSIGLEYRTFLCVQRGEKNEFFKYEDYKFEKCGTVDIFGDFLKFINDELDFVNDVLEFYEEHMIAPGIFGTNKPTNSQHN